MRIAASAAQVEQVRVLPRGARMTRVVVGMGGIILHDAIVS